MSTTKRLFMAGDCRHCFIGIRLPSCARQHSVLPQPPLVHNFSAATVETIIDTPVTVQVNTYSTELTAQMQGGPVLYDQTFPVPFADPVFQSAIGTAELVLTGAGAASFLVPLC